MAVKLLEIGDIHFRGTNPRNRTDDYSTAVKHKLLEVFSLALQHKVDAIICPGDIFDTYLVSIPVLMSLYNILEQSPVPIYATAGNHDLPGYNVAAFGRTSLYLLDRFSKNLFVVNDPSKPVIIGGLVQLTFTPYTEAMDVGGYGYSPTGDAATSDYLKVHVSHGMLLDHAPPFPKFSLVQDVQTSADIVFCGHDHTGFGISRRSDGKSFVNLGSLTRLSASLVEIERSIQAALLTVEDDLSYTIHAIPLESAKPGNVVLDRSGIEASQKRQYAMEQFSALLQTSSGEAVAINVDQMVEMIASLENFSPDVVSLALAKIAEQPI